MLERIMNLGVRHGTGVEPHVDKVGLPLHRLTRGTNQNDLIHKRTVQIYFVIIVLTVIARNETTVFQRIGSHQSGRYRFLDFGIQFLHRTDTDFLTVFRPPDRQRRTPITATAQVPVIQVLQPFTETSGPGGCRLPVDGTVQFYHPFLGSRTADEPTVERIIQNRLVRPPTMRIVVHVFLYLECHSALLQFHAERHVEGFVLVGLLRVVGIFHELAFPLPVFVHTDTTLHEVLVQLVQQIKLTGQIHHRTELALAVDQLHGRNAGRLGHLRVVRTESRSDMHDTRTVFRRHVISGDDAESPFPGIYPRKQLFVGHTDQIRPEVFTHNLIRYHFVPRLVTVQRHILALRVQISPQTRLGQHHCYGFTAVHIISTHAYILYFRPYAQCRVGRKRPRRSGPCQEIRRTPARHFRARIEHPELCRHRRVFHVTVTTGLVQLMRTQPRTGCGRIRLYRISLI